MVHDAFYANPDFWIGAGVGLMVLLLAYLAMSAKKWLVNNIRAQVAERVSKDFVVAAEIFDLLRVPGQALDDHEPDFYPSLQARVESHSSFFQRLMNERRQFCFFFGETFDVAFEDVLATYNDFVSGCEMLHLYRDVLGGGSLEALGPHQRYLPVIFKHEDPMQDVTRFKLMRATALIDSVYAPIVAERNRRKQRAARREAIDALMAH